MGLEQYLTIEEVIAKIGKAKLANDTEGLRGLLDLALRSKEWSGYLIAQGLPQRLFQEMEELNKQAVPPGMIPVAK